jgi:hypothetical protein
MRELWVTIDRASTMVTAVGELGDLVAAAPPARAGTKPDHG